MSPSQCTPKQVPIEPAVGLAGCCAAPRKAMPIRPNAATTPVGASPPQKCRRLPPKWASRSPRPRHSTLGAGVECSPRHSVIDIGRRIRARDHARARRTEAAASDHAGFTQGPPCSGPRLDCARMGSLRRRNRPLWRRRPRQVADRAAASDRYGAWLGLARPARRSGRNSWRLLRRFAR